ncbi:MAG: biotin synthase auxiliary protein BsaP [Acidimicrobiales bacterium]
MSYCAGCGKPSGECNGCRSELDPPRYCPKCGQRLRVQVMPGHFLAQCRTHGEVGWVAAQSQPDHSGEGEPT